MQYVKTDRLTPGMISTRAIFDERGMLLLAANHTLTTDIIESMKRIGMSGVYIYDEYSDFEELESIVDEKKRHELVSSLRDFKIDQVILLTGAIVDDILAKDEFMVDLKDLAVYDQSTYEHSVNVATLATACGIGLGLDNDELKSLALAGALHDIGKRAIPKEILNKAGELSAEERNIMKRHPQLGYDMLYDNNNISSYVRAGIISHHENYDGTGYPYQLKGEAIPLFARIIHIADVYDALTKKRVYKPSYKQSETIEYLMAECGTMFDIQMVTAFLKYMVVYPVGSDVLLSDGRVAHVVKNRSSAVMRPVVVTEDKQKLDLAKDYSCLNITVISEVDKEISEVIEEREEGYH
ncbi:MAG: HD-GYP domain-containing protein [Lachnospiraceae bacterium]|nr:HD-GYP domain-containing protein [Lachnospiraceae bacterium]